VPDVVARCVAGWGEEGVVGGAVVGNGV